MDLTDIRREIDRIDDEIVDLFVRRMEAVYEVAARKNTAAAPIRDLAREQAIVDRLSARAGERCAPYIAPLYERIFELSRNCQATLINHSGDPE